MKKLNRRRFVKYSALIGGSALLPIHLACRPETKAKKKNKIGVALLGLGYYSRDLLAPALQLTEHCYLAGIVTGSPSKIPVWQKKYGITDQNVYSYENMHEIANNDEIDVIYIVTPTGTHARFAIAAAATGKHVWCEKPFAMNVAECQSIIDACKKNKVELTIGYRMLHEPNTQTLMSYTKSKPFGSIKRLESYAGYAGGGGTGWRFEKAMGGGAMYDMGVYTVNGMRYATNLMPKKVISAAHSTTKPQYFKEVDETTEYVLEFENGILGYGRTSVGESINHLKVECEKGYYELRPMQTYGGVVGSRSDGVLLDTHLPNQQAKQMDDDAKSLLAGEKMLIDPEEGLKDIHIINGIFESAKTQQS
ncbi:MAG: Gfo/Idh/MocA family oxidoreductase, partial [Bacteroidota bacterium]